MTLITSLLAALVLGGCVGAPPTPTRYYTLRTTPAPDPAAANAKFLITIGPITLPESVDRPQIVVQESENKVRLLDNDRWAEPLRAAILRVLADEIGRQMPSARASAYGDYSADSPVVRVLVDVRAFDSVPGEGVVLDALWQIKTEKTVHSGRSRFREPTKTPAIESLVQAHGRALSALASELASILSRHVPKQ